MGNVSPLHGSDRQRREIAEAALARTEESFRLLVEAVQDYAIFRLDPQGYIQTWNAGAQRLKGYRASEIIGSHFSRFYTPQDIARGHPADELRIAAAEGRYEEEGWRIKKDGSRFWASVTITALRDADGQLRGFGKVTRDLTERKAAEDELLHANDLLEQRVAERTAELQKAKEVAEEAVKARDKFLSIASHELKTPLTSLSLQTQLRKLSLKRGLFDMFSPTKLTQLIEADERQIRRLNHLVEDMLDVSRLATGRFHLYREDFDLIELTREVLERFHPLLVSHKVEVTLAAPATLFGEWDRCRLDQVLSNLLSNAIKYGDKKPVGIGIQETGPRTQIRISDQGMGVAPVDQERIFEPFERATGDGIGGLGLGLYITRQIVELHGGTIGVTSMVGGGSTFVVDLPTRP